MKPLIYLGLAAALMACQNGEPTEPDESVVIRQPDRQELKKTFQEYENNLARAYGEKDLNLFRQFYAEDAISYGEGREQLYGRKEMEGHFLRNVVRDSADFNFEYITLDVFTQGDLAVETGKWVERDAEGSELDHGFYTVVFKRQGDGWRAIRDIWNTATPPEVTKQADQK